MNLTEKEMKMIDHKQLLNLIASSETLTVEFKSEKRQQLSDNDLAEAVVCMSNAEGGYILLGVEDDGEITGARQRNGDSTDYGQLAAKIYSRTNPNIQVKIQNIEHEGKTVLVINVPHSGIPVGTSKGLYVKRRIAGDGKPACLPYPPHEMTGDFASRKQMDYTAQKIKALHADAFDPLEIERLFSVIKANPKSDRYLLEMPRNDALKSLGLLLEHGDSLVPSVAGILLLGRKEITADYVTNHEIAFQFIKGTDVPVNEFLKEPLLKSLETIWNYFSARNDIDSEIKGLYRREIPNYDEKAFREAANNAVSHRDYTVTGTVYIQWYENRIEISNPGGLVRGVTLDNILSVSPTPRNPLLADVFKRIGLVERSGRGVDIIFTGQLKYGRKIPDYSRTTPEKVALTLCKDSPKMEIIEFWQRHEKEHSKEPDFEHRYIFDRLYHDKKDSIKDISTFLQRTEQETALFISQMMGWGYVNHIESGNTYAISARCKQKIREILEGLHAGQSRMDRPKGSGRTTGETVGETVGKTVGKATEQILAAIRENPSITRDGISRLTGLSVRGVEWNLAKLKKDGLIRRVGSTKSGHWIILAVKKKKGDSK